MAITGFQSHIKRVHTDLLKLKFKVTESMLLRTHVIGGVRSTKRIASRARKTGSFPPITKALVIELAGTICSFRCSIEALEEVRYFSMLKLVGL